MSDIYRIRRTIKQEEARPNSSDQPSYEHPEGNPVKDEELMAPLEGANEAVSSQEDEYSEVPDKQSNRCTDPGTRISPPSEPAHRETLSSSQLRAAFAALPPLIYPQARGRHTLTQVAESSAALPHPQVYTPLAGVTASVEPTVLSAMPTSQVSQNIAPPVFLPHNASVPYYTPSPLVVFMSHPPYQMTLYPIYPVFFPPPVI